MWPDGSTGADNAGSGSGTGDSIETVRAASAVALLAAIGEVQNHEEGHVVGACVRAESFLASWRDELPFGRPIA